MGQNDLEREAGNLRFELDASPPLRSLKETNVRLKSCHRVDNALSGPLWLPSLRHTGVMIIPAGLLGLVTVGAPAATAAQSRVSLTQAPLVMRLSKDQFRVAFGINGDQCFPNGCRGSIRYRVIWRTEDGLTRSEIRQVSYAVVPNSRRSITVDRQYFDTAEGEHTTEVVSVSVDVITCRRGVESRPS